jgi:hypothetical protein
MARLSFQNVPTKSGGVISGNISTGTGSPFGAGGKYEAQIRSIKAEIASKPVGYYDPPPMTLWKEDNLLIESELEDNPAVKVAQEKLKNLIGAYDPSHPRATKLGRYGSAGDIMAMQFKIDAQNKIINDIRLKITAERNAPMIKAQQEQEALEADLIRKLEIELAVQRVLDKQIINQRPTPTPTAPEITTSPTSYLPLAVVGIVIVVILIILRRRA